MAPALPAPLVADEGYRNGRSALAAVRALGTAGYQPLVTATQTATLASSSRWCAGVVHVPPIGEAGWVEAVTAGPERLVIPASDDAVVALDLPGAPLTNKRVVGERARAAGFPVPEEQHFPDRAALVSHADELPYPIVVKPLVRLGPNPASATRIDAPQQLQHVPDRPMLVQPFLAGPIQAFAGVVAGGRLIAAVHQRYLRIWPPQCGVASAAVTVEEDVSLEEKVLDLVDGHDGIVQVQFVGGHVIDVNPRVYGSLPLAVRAGANLPALWAAASTDQLPSKTVRARPGVYYRWLDADIRAIWWDVRIGHSSVRDGVRALTPHRGTAHSIEDWADPKPVMVRLRNTWR